MGIFRLRAMRNASLPEAVSYTHLFTAWLMRIARRVVADYYTELNKLPYYEANPNKLTTLTQMTGCYVRDFSDDVLMTAVVTDFILSLDEPWASAYYLYFFMGIPIREDVYKRQGWCWRLHGLWVNLAQR